MLRKIQSKTIALSKYMSSLKTYYLSLGFLYLSPNRSVTFGRRRLWALVVSDSSAVCCIENILPDAPRYFARRFDLLPVQVVGDVSDGQLLMGGGIDFPVASVFTVANAFVVGGSEMLITADCKLVYDEIACGNPKLYGVKAGGIIPTQPFGLKLPAYRKGRVVIQRLSQHFQQEIDVAIHGMGDHSNNYYHWLFECLPRIILAQSAVTAQDVPILVRKGLAPQILQSLRLIAGDRPVIEISHGEIVKVKTLIFPAPLSPTHDNYSAVLSLSDFLIAPEAVGLVRSSFAIYREVMGERRIYIARKSGRRALRNEASVIAALLPLGFEVVYPEQYSFEEQIQLFSQASCVVGATGAGFANIAFCSPDCKVVVFASNSLATNYYIFAQIAQHAGVNLTYLSGAADYPKKVHSSYTVDVKALVELVHGA